MTRKYWILIISVISWSAPRAQLTNQHLYDTMPNMVDHYYQRTAQFAKEEVVTGKVIFLGNSITEGGNWAELTNDKTVINRGVGGDVTFGVLNRLHDITSRKPSKLFILIGINDICKDFPHAVIVDNYSKIVREVKSKSPATKIYIQSILPLNPEYPRFPQHYDKVDHVIAVNQLLQELANAEDVVFVDLYSLFLDNKGRMNEYYTTDGLHLNTTGYKIWVTYLRDKQYIN